jgi:hypothetical protein
MMARYVGMNRKTPGVKIEEMLKSETSLFIQAVLPMVRRISQERKPNAPGSNLLKTEWEI